MSPDSDPNLCDLLSELDVAPAANFWSELDDAIASTANELGEGRRRHSANRRLLTLAAASLVLIAGTVAAVRSLDDRTAPIDVVDGAPTESTAADPPSATAVEREPVLGILEARTTVEGSFSHLTLAGRDASIDIPSNHSVDVTGQPLVTNVIGDRDDGFLYGLIDYDDSRADRLSYLLHVPAAATRPEVLATEPIDGIATLLGTTDGPTGVEVVYQTLLGEQIRAASLIDGSVRTVTSATGIHAAGDLVLTTEPGACQPYEIIGIDGQAASDLRWPHQDCAAEPDPRPEARLSATARRLAVLEPDGGTIDIWDLTDGSLISSLLVRDDEFGAATAILRFDGSAVLVRYFDGSDQPHDLAFTSDGSPTDAALSLYDSLVIDPALVLAL